MLEIVRVFGPRARGAERLVRFLIVLVESVAGRVYEADGIFEFWAGI